MREKGFFYIFVPSDLDLCPQICSPSYSCPALRLQSFLFRENRIQRHGTDGRVQPFMKPSRERRIIIR